MSEGGRWLPGPSLGAWLTTAIWLAVAVGLWGTHDYQLKNGEEIELKTIPVDPRDLLRGDYVVLAYEISTPAHHGMRFDAGSTVYVGLERSGDVWDAIAVDNDVRRPWEVAIRGHVVSERPFVVEYGIEAYFVPEDRGHEIERAEDVKAVVSVERDGTARIVYLIVDGERWEP